MGLCRSRDTLTRAERVKAQRLLQRARRRARIAEAKLLTLFKEAKEDAASLPICDTNREDLERRKDHFDYVRAFMFYSN